MRGRRGHVAPYSKVNKSWFWFHICSDLKTLEFCFVFCFQLKIVSDNHTEGKWFQKHCGTTRHDTYIWTNSRRFDHTEDDAYISVEPKPGGKVWTFGGKEEKKIHSVISSVFLPTQIWRKTLEMVKIPAQEGKNGATEKKSGVPQGQRGRGTTPRRPQVCRWGNGWGWGGGRVRRKLAQVREWHGYL